MSEWKKICLVQDIPVLGSRRVQRAKGMDVAVFRNDQDQVFALVRPLPAQRRPVEPRHRLWHQRGLPVAQLDDWLGDWLRQRAR